MVRAVPRAGRTAAAGAWYLYGGVPRDPAEDGRPPDERIAGGARGGGGSGTRGWWAVSKDYPLQTRLKDAAECAMAWAVFLFVCLAAIAICGWAARLL